VQDIDAKVESVVITRLQQCFYDKRQRCAYLHVPHPSSGAIRNFVGFADYWSDENRDVCRNIVAESVPSSPSTAWEKFSFKPVADFEFGFTRTGEMGGVGRSTVGVPMTHRLASIGGSTVSVNPTALVQY
jgi:hypothetical protein